MGATGEAVYEGKQSSYPSLFQFISYIVVMQKLIFSETKKKKSTGFIYVSILFRIVWGFSVNPIVIPTWSMFAQSAECVLYRQT